ncbi:MAG: pyridoxal-phosphate dependent enzyme, partial [Oscillospiraceae bacterium]|nr:pyridoxal-phosphate dependent enzyme [Oscillospiraceae bacterium]
MKSLELAQIEQAARRLESVIHATPVDSSRTFSELSGAEMYLKCENLQKTGSFKVRGAYNKIARMAEDGPVPPLVAASAGNHAQGVAYAAARVGAKAMIVMPRSTPIAKISATEGYGAEIILHGSVYDEAYAYARELCEERGAVFVHPFDDEDVIAGQGTIALEILRELPTVDAVLIPAGGGGLL